MRASDELSFKLHNLLEIVKLDAFAAEARRPLNAIHSLAQILPGEVGDNIERLVNAPNAWNEIEDNSGGVLHYIADELESAREALEGVRHE